MLIEAKTSGDSQRIKCGNSSCGAEYTPSPETSAGPADYSCPVCGRGKFGEAFVKQGKQILHG